MLAYIDTSIWITRTEGRPVYRYVIENHLEQLKQEGWRLCTSQAVIMETLYKPYRDKNQDLVTVYTDLFAKTQMLLNYTDLLEDGLRMVQVETLKAMDALHVALALHHGCKKFISTDPDFRNLLSIPVYWIDLSRIS